MGDKPDESVFEPLPEGTTHVLLAIDRSGSMSRLADDVRGGFNQFLANLAGLGADGYRVTVLLFDHTTQELCSAAPLAEVPPLDDQNYQPMGMTALYDAVGKLIGQFERATTLADGDRVMLVVQTDGYENSSREYAASDILRMITEREKTGRWMTSYLGAGPSAWYGGEAMGMRSVNTTADPYGTRAAYGAVATASAKYSSGASAAETFDVLERTATAGPE